MNKLTDLIKYSVRRIPGGILDFLSAAEFLPDFLHFGLFRTIRLIPAFCGHFGIDSFLHIQGIIQRGLERILHIAGTGFDSSVKIHITSAFFENQQILH